MSVGISALELLVICHSWDQKLLWTLDKSPNPFLLLARILGSWIDVAFRLILLVDLLALPSVHPVTL